MKPYKPYLEYHHYKAAMAKLGIDEFDFTAAAFAYAKVKPTRKVVEMALWEINQNRPPAAEFMEDLCLDVLAGRIHVTVEKEE